MGNRSSSNRSDEKAVDLERSFDKTSITNDRSFVETSQNSGDRMGSSSRQEYRQQCDKQREGRNPPLKAVDRRKCFLLRFVWDQDWPNVMHRLDVQPEEAGFWTRTTHRTALHLACMGAHGCPTYVVQRLLEVNPYALWIQDKELCTPLHYACRSSSPNTNDAKLVSLLCQFWKEIMTEKSCSISCRLPNLLLRTPTTDHEGENRESGSQHQTKKPIRYESPMAIACQHYDRISMSQRCRFPIHLVVKELLRLVDDVPKLRPWICPFTGVERATFLPSASLRRHQSPLMSLDRVLSLTLEESFFGLVTENKAESERLQKTNMTIRNQGFDHAVVERLQQAMVEIEQGCQETAGSVSSKKALKVLSTIDKFIGLDDDDPIKVLLILWATIYGLCLATYPDQSMLQTLSAMKHPSLSLLQLACRVLKRESSHPDKRRGWLPLHDAVTNPTIHILDPILGAYPSAASIAVQTLSSSVNLSTDRYKSAQETYPLYMAIRQLHRNKTWALIETDPSILRKRDSSTKLWPFQLAASVATANSEEGQADDDTYELTFIYDLLLQTPDLVKATDD